jgi:hypothetical protein
MSDKPTIKKIRLHDDLPVGREHGATKGRIFEAEEVPTEERYRGFHYWITGDTGERVGVLNGEAEIVHDQQTRGQSYTARAGIRRTAKSRGRTIGVFLEPA